MGIIIFLKRKYIKKQETPIIRINGLYRICLCQTIAFAIKYTANITNIDKKQFNLTTSLQSLGFHKVEIILYKEVIAEVKVQLVK